MTHRVFHVVAEDPEKEHIPGNMKDAAMQEHGGDKGGGLENRRNQTPSVEEPGQRKIVREKVPVTKKDSDIDPDKRPGHVGCAAGRIVVTKREHDSTVGFGR